MLEVTNLTAGYRGKSVLRDVSVSVGISEFVAVIGANTAGKSTLLRSISRLVSIYSGSIKFEGAEISNAPAHRVPSLGIAHVPEGRHVFSHMTVEENIAMGVYAIRGRTDLAAQLDRMYTMFPRLGERRHQFAGTLSGGEQQMVALARALVLEPKLLILDEPTHGLAPKIVDSLHETLVTIHQSGLSILLVEQNVLLALSVATRGYVLEAGRVVLEGASPDLAGHDEVRRAYLGI
jgi:branched-chain amino acid transport system ATP-binding protein